MNIVLEHVGYIYIKVSICIDEIVDLYIIQRNIASFNYTFTPYLASFSHHTLHTPFSKWLQSTQDQVRRWTSLRRVSKIPDPSFRKLPSVLILTPC